MFDAEALGFQIGHDILAPLIVYGGLLVLYFLPAVLAWRRHKPHLPWVWVMNLLVGWFPVFWVVAMFWVYWPESEEERTYRLNPTGDVEVQDP